MKPPRISAMRIARTVARIALDRRAGTAIEYGLIAALVVITMMAALIGLADTTSGLWNNISANVAAAH